MCLHSPSGMLTLGAVNIANARPAALPHTRLLSPASAPTDPGPLTNSAQMELTPAINPALGSILSPLARSRCTAVASAFLSITP